MKIEELETELKAALRFKTTIDKLESIIDGSGVRQEDFYKPMRLSRSQFYKKKIARNWKVNEVMQILGIAIAKKEGNSPVSVS